MERTPEPRPVSGVPQLRSSPFKPCVIFMQEFPYPISYHSFRFFPQVIFPTLDRSYALSSDLWTLEVCQACDLPGANQLYPAKCLQGSRAPPRGRVHSNRSEAGGPEPRPEQLPPSSQVGGRLSYVSLQASGARLRAPGRLLEERAVSQQAPPRGGRPRAACSQFRARVVPVAVAAATAAVRPPAPEPEVKAASPPSSPSGGRRDGGPRGGGGQRGGGGGGRFGGSGGLVPGARLLELPALRAAGAGAEPELAADGLLGPEGLRLQGPPGDAAQTPGGTDAARRAAPAGPGPGRRP